MGALAHYLEKAGIPTTQISLIYEHTQAIRPPRALWVPFELGRPLGVPNDPAFQREVLVETLKLLEGQTVPMLESFSKQAPAGHDETAKTDDTWACPVNFSPGPADETDLEKQIKAFLTEVAGFQNWYDIGRQDVSDSHGSLKYHGLQSFCWILNNQTPWRRIWKI